MRIPDGYHDLPAGKLATVVTYLEMRAAPPARPERTDALWSLRRVEQPDRAWYRELIRVVGTEWLWSSRLEMQDAELAAILSSPDVDVFALESAGEDVGVLELDFRVAGECEIAFFGLAPSMIGSGAGRWLMNRAIARAFGREGAQPVKRFWLHTCSLDSPDALPFYQRSGFEPYERKIEVFDDPRLIGIHPRTAAPRVPVIG